MINLLLKAILIVFFSFSCNNVFSQSEPDTLKKEQIVVIKMNNGDEFKGTIERKDSAILILKTENGDLNLKADKIKKIEKYDYEGKFEFANPHYTRYFFGPSAIPLEKGEGYYQNILVTTNFVNYGITKNISIGGGFEFISTINGTPIWFLTPKAGFTLADKIHVGGGLILAGFAGEGTASIGYGVFTYGREESNISLGAGYGLLDGEISEFPSIMISGTHRVSKSIALLSENYLIPDNFYFGIQGIRILSKKNAFDIGALFISSLGPALPFAGYVRVF